jgi:hypothetical protein
LVARRVSDSNSPASRGRPATTPEARENQLINMAVDLVERQLSEGSASAQVISHYLKLGSTREKLEQERLRHENELLKVKKEQIESASKMEETYTAALEAMRSYSGNAPVSTDQDYDDR